MPWRLAVDAIARGACKLSITIRSFSSSDQRRRQTYRFILRPLDGASCQIFVRSVREAFKNTVEQGACFMKHESTGNDPRLSAVALRRISKP